MNDDTSETSGDGDFEYELQNSEPEAMRGVHAALVDEVPSEATVTDANGTCLADDEVIQTLFENAENGVDVDTKNRSGHQTEYVGVGTGQATKEELYRAAACLDQFEFSTTPQASPDGYYVRDHDRVLAFGAAAKD